MIPIRFPNLREIPLASNYFVTGTTVQLRGLDI